jgi:hypothetical protein
MLLPQISPSDPVTSQALRGLQESCPILADVEFYSKNGPADHVKKAPSSSDTDTFRDINEDNSPTAATRDYKSFGKKIVSFDAKVDVVLEDRNEDPATELATQTYLEAKERGYVLQKKFFDGDSASNSDEFDGIKNIVQSANIITPDDNIGVMLGNSDTHRQAQQVALETFIRTARKIKGGATHAYMNGLLKIRWLTIAKELGYYRNSKDSLGNEVEMIGNIILRDAGLDTSGDDILPFNETVNSEKNTSSIYFTRWGERTDLSVLTSKGLVGRYSGQHGNFYINNVNMDAVMVLQDDTAVYQHKGWRIEDAVAAS